MKMITLFLPEKYLEMLDTLVASNLYPNRSEALRMATWKFLHESVSMLKISASTTTATHATTAKGKAKNSKKQPSADADTDPEPESSSDPNHQACIAGPAELDAALDELDGEKTTADGDAGDAGTDPFDDIVREQQHA